MAYDVPTRQAFRARYAEFASVSDATVDVVLADAAAEVSTSWLEADYPRAIMLLTAHLLLVEGALDVAAGEQPTMTTAGAVTAFQVGDVKVTYAGGSSSAGGASDPNGYGATEYGRRFLALMRRNFPAVAIV